MSNKSNTLSLATIGGLLNEFAMHSFNKMSSVYDNENMSADDRVKALDAISREHVAKLDTLRYIAMRCGASDCTPDALNKLFQS